MLREVPAMRTCLERGRMEFLRLAGDLPGLLSGVFEIYATVARTDAPERIEVFPEPLQRGLSSAF